MKHTLFKKILLTLSLFLVAVLLLYGYSNAKHETVVKKQLRDMSMNQLSFFADQMDNTVLQLETFSRILLRDSNIIELTGFPLLNSPYEIMRKKLAILEKLQLQSASASWTNDITVFAPSAGQALSTATHPVSSNTDLKRWAMRNWNYLAANGSQDEGEFVHISVEPYGMAQRIEQANSVVEIRFSERNIVQMLNKFNDEGKGNPLFYQRGYPAITNSSFDQRLLDDVLEYMDLLSTQVGGNQVVRLQNVNYLIAFKAISSLQGYVVNVIPLDDIMAPIRQNNYYVYGSICLMLLVSVFVAWVVYINLQVPLRALVQGIRQVKMGHYGTPIETPVKNEFLFIVRQFNEMTLQIQELVENVLEEKIRASEAELKQLQSQINPHFLYNSLSYMVNMVKMDRKDAALQMGYHLADFYRYSTRVEEQEVLLRDEIANASDYLSIHYLRLSRMSYEIKVEPSMNEVPMPRLILQPIVENALIHGIELMAGDSNITITGFHEADRFKLVVEDNGGKLTEAKVQEMRQRLANVNDDRQVSCGLANVHRRLQLRFGKDAGIGLYLSPHTDCA
ncbi:histidine kinase [Paenibacillus sp. D2_2]|uniref:sensor histidine kinase n=1 Tax=Paenibacillus sp. D2_2 TaxID=3073092 RepID=UPI002816771F|nr:histidine kinase [Paenibacillus sp. D2_2]WMT43023.1 histidine kinase [Paenibacillus sp. D2_2]